MRWTRPVEHLLIILIFVVVGFFMNFLQFLVFLLFWRIHKPTYRSLVHKLQFGHWSIVSWIGFYYSGSKLKIFSSDKDLKYFGKEAAILIPNHRYSLDFLTTVMIPDQFDALGLLKAMQKNSIKFMPIIGWNFWFTENIFLARKASTDILKIENGINQLVSAKTPFWMTLYAEGSRFTVDKHRASEEIAKEKKYKSLKHHLQPRPTGFVTIIKKLRENKDQKVMLYDMTIQQQRNENKTMAELLSLSPVEFTVYIKRIEVDQVPEGEEAEWLRELYQKKDKRFEQLLQGNELLEIDQAKRQILDTPIKSKYMFITWCLTILPLTIFGWICFIQQSFSCFMIGISFPALCQFLVAQIIRTGDLKSSSSYGLKKE
jgi:lysophosphatidic acid acyltransferase/lysophosphatidylinositol acyltransferase